MTDVVEKSLQGACGRASYGALALALAAVAGWLILAGVYGAAMYATSSGAMDILLSMRVGLTTTIVPVAMGLGVWWLSGRYPVPETRVFTFGAVHILLGLIFASIWSGWIVIGMRPGSGMPRAILLHEVLPWQFVIGLLLYGLIGGSAYAARGVLQTRDLRLIAERSERLRVQSDLAVLRAHINPHFLFNTLHSVGELLAAEPASAQKALERLADLFRYTLRLDRQQIDVVSLEDEWRVTESYLWLEQLRIGARLTIDAHFEEDALECAVPPFTLQPIVENAIRHGLSQKPGGGTLTLRGSEIDGRLVIEIRDDGAGATAEALENSRGLGLRSVRQRLAALYGERGSLSVNASSAGVAVTITMPADAAP